LEELRERSRVGGEVAYLSHQAGEQEEERESPSSLAEVVGVRSLHIVGALQRYANAAVEAALIEARRRVRLNEGREN
jgi:hypothetical protein